MATIASGALTLDAETAGEVGWWLAPEATETIPEGDYEVVAILNIVASNAPQFNTLKANARKVNVPKAKAPKAKAPRTVTLKANAAKAWTGKVESERVSIRISERPSAPSAQQQEERQLLLANYSILRDDSKQALAHIDGLLAEQPKSITGLAFKAALPAEAGNKQEAIDLYICRCRGSTGL